MLLYLMMRVVSHLFLHHHRLADLAGPALPARTLSRTCSYRAHDAGPPYKASPTVSTKKGEKLDQNLFGCPGCDGVGQVSGTASSMNIY